MRLIYLFLFLFGTLALTGQEKLEFKPQQVVLAVQDVEQTAKWYVEFLDFELGKSFTVPKAGLEGRIVRKGDFEVMFMRGREMQPLPNHRQSTFTDLATVGTKRIAFAVADLTRFAARLRERGVPFDVEPQLFADPDTGLRFNWLVIRDIEGNLIEFMELLE